MTPAGFSSSTYDPNGIVAGPGPLRHKKVTLLSGAGALVRGTVLGRVAGAIAAAVANTGNTGNGTFSGTPTAAAGLKEGTYKVTFIEPATDLGRFVVEDPDGIILPAKGIVGTAFAGGHLAFTIQDGATDFVSGDGFTIVVAQGTKYLKAVAAATDGSQLSDCVLAEDTDATSADKDTDGYVTGDFDEAKLTFGSGLTADTERERLRRRGIHLIKVQG